MNNKKIYHPSILCLYISLLEINDEQPDLLIINLTLSCQQALDCFKPYSGFLNSITQFSEYPSLLPEPGYLTKNSFI